MHLQYVSMSLRSDAYTPYKYMQSVIFGVDDPTLGCWLSDSDEIYWLSEVDVVYVGPSRHRTGRTLFRSWLGLLHFQAEAEAGADSTCGLNFQADSVTNPRLQSISSRR